VELEKEKENEKKEVEEEWESKKQVLIDGKTGCSPIAIWCLLNFTSYFIPLPVRCQFRSPVLALRLSVYRYPSSLSLSLSLSSISFSIITMKFIRAQAMKSQKDRRDIALPFL